MMKLITTLLIFLVALIAAQQVVSAARVLPNTKGLTDQKNFLGFSGAGTYGGIGQNGIPFGGVAGLVGGGRDGTGISGVTGVVGTGPNGNSITGVNGFGGLGGLGTGYGAGGDVGTLPNP